jgi:ADP-ribose pyrophosphatase YjhB (NUDIX family)
MSDMTPQLQSGVLAYRRLKNGRLEVLLVKKPLSQNWGIPKGKLEDHLSFPENAAKEAFEEAGVKGLIQQQALGSYKTMKRRGDHEVIIEVWVYLLEVTRVARKWPEKATRLVRWFTPTEAERLLREPLLIEHCQKLEQLVSGASAGI